MLVLCMLIGYLIGSVNGAILIVKLRYRKDVRSGGSGNAGATNAARTFGLSAGLLTLAWDIFKAVLCCAAGRLLAGESGQIFAGLFCVLGHCWPVFFRFKGGKGMAVAAGVLLALDPLLLLLIAAFFVLVFLCWQRVSLCTVLSVLIFPPLYYLRTRTVGVSLIVGTVICLLIIFQHRQNIVRLIHHTEPRFEFHGKK